MALPSTIHRFRLDISDVDRGVYTTVDQRIACHPSESLRYLMTRVIALGLHQDDGVELSRAGLCDPDDPPLSAQDPKGGYSHWIEVGSPSPERLHKATKASKAVWVYTYKDPELLVAALQRAKIHRPEAVNLLALPGETLDALAETLGRTNDWTLVRSEGELFITTGETTHQLALRPYPI
jgi:uncharacterized protein YaeQ